MCKSHHQEELHPLRKHLRPARVRRQRLPKLGLRDRPPRLAAARDSQQLLGLGAQVLGQGDGPFG